MKLKISLALVLLATLSQTCVAEEIFLTKNEKGDTSWYAYSETVQFNSEQAFAMIGQRQKGKVEFRIFEGVTAKDCAAGFGVIYHRSSPSAQWTPGLTWTSSNVTVLDTIALQLCSLFKKDTI